MALSVPIWPGLSPIPALRERPCGRFFPPPGEVSSSSLPRWAQRWMRRWPSEMRRPSPEKVALRGRTGYDLRYSIDKYT